MTSRSDIIQDFNPSPRVSVVDSPSVEFNAQDIVDTLRDKEVSGRGIAETKLINGSGKEDLGGGVSVGITLALQNNLIAFEGRTTPAQTGTVTTGSTSPISGLIDFIDTSATFISNGVTRGSLLVNFTDNSVAEVHSAVSEDQLTTKTLVNGIGNTYDINDVYHIFNIIQCEVLGGNVVAVDELGATISPILPTAFTQVIRTASSSATLTDQQAIQFSSYQGAVWIDELSSTTGTDFPAGTRQFPVNNLADAHAIAIIVGLQEFGVIGDLTIGASAAIPGFTIRGQNALNTTVMIDNAADVTNCEIFESTITGFLDGDVVIRESVIFNLEVIAGFIFESAFASTGSIVLATGTTAHFLDCFSGTPGSGTPIIDMNGSGTSLALRGYNGGIKLTNKTGIDAVTIDLSSGQVILDNTVTNGQIVVRGVGKLVDTNGDPILTGVWNGATIINETINSTTIGGSGTNEEIAQAVWDHII